MEDPVLARLQSVGWTAWHGVNLILADAENNADEHTDDHPDIPVGLEERRRTLKIGSRKRKTHEERKAFHGVTNDEKRKRAFFIQKFVKLGMAAEQIVDFLPTWGIEMSRSQVYEYMANQDDRPRVKLPRGYKRGEREQSHHDYFTFRVFIRIAQDIAKHGLQCSHLQKGQSPCDNARMRPDFGWRVLHYLFFMELQLSDLTETRWRPKLRKYPRLRQLLGHPFRALIIVDQRKDMAYVRRHARAVLQEGDVKGTMFLFICLNDVIATANDLACDPVWMDEHGNRRALLEWLRVPGQKPAVQRQ